MSTRGTLLPMQEIAGDAALVSWLHDEYETARAQLARELHDELGGLLVAARMDLSAITRELPDVSEKVRAQLARIGASLDAAVAFERRIVEQLRPGALDHLGLFTALRSHLHTVCELHGIEREEQWPDREPEFTPEATLLLFRMQQAALEDMVARGGARRVRFTVILTESMLLEMHIADYGERAEQSVQKPAPAFALQCHRAARLGGSCEQQPRSDGMTVLVRLPLSRLIAA